jgi:hypothetical protein
MDTKIQGTGVHRRERERERERERVREIERVRKFLLNPPNL